MDLLKNPFLALKLKIGTQKGAWWIEHFKYGTIADLQNTTLVDMGFLQLVAAYVKKETH